MTRLDHTRWHSPTGNRTRVVWVKTTYPDQLDYWGCAPAGNQTRVSSVAGTYTITVLPALIMLQAAYLLTPIQSKHALQQIRRKIAL